ncbi:MAG: hypothetical protein HY741_14280 [Chloroflexi bacterium]|nr:hypothetical protein [Chloroflexota bacterium]
MAIRDWASQRLSQTRARVNEKRAPSNGITQQTKEQGQPTNENGAPLLLPDVCSFVCHSFLNYGQRARKQKPRLEGGAVWFTGNINAK